MAVYIPDDWVVDPKNKETIHEIFDEYYFTNLRLEENPDYPEMAKEELRVLGETVIIEKLEDGTIKIN